jgi:hypothetical protein
MPEAGRTEQPGHAGPLIDRTTCDCPGPPYRIGDRRARICIGGAGPPLLTVLRVGESPDRHPCAGDSSPPAVLGVAGAVSDPLKRLVVQDGDDLDVRLDCRTVVVFGDRQVLVHPGLRTSSAR